MHINVQQLHGQHDTAEIEIEPKYAISYVKVQIQYKLGIPAHQIQLFLNDKQLASKKLQDDKKVADYNIENGSTICFENILSRGNGPGFGTTFADINNEEGLKRMEFAISAPRWRRAETGLCLEGICLSESCAAHSQSVILNIGYDKFDLLADVSELTCKCPICGEFVEPVTCAFNNCWWRWWGFKQEGKGKAPKKCSGDWKYADNAYHYFDENTSGLVTWKQLMLEVVEKKPI